MEKLKGNRAGQCGIRVNDQWRVCLDWNDGHAWNVEIVLGKRGIAADTALRLARYFSTSQEVGMNLQLRYELETGPTGAVVRRFCENGGPPRGAACRAWP